ncbi:MAG: 2-hydroxyacyl-CoA dehydratase subunit D [Candidatus Syntropharchaeia archaeon]
MKEIKFFLGAVSDPYRYLREWKDKNGKKIIGVFPMWIPEEIIHAVGIHPVVIWRSNELVTWGHSHVPPYDCGITRSFIDDAVKGKLDFMDGMVFSVRQCLQAGEAPLIIERNVSPSYLKCLYLPPIYLGNATKKFLMRELENFKRDIEKFSGKKITEKDLRNSIEIYNRNRALLRKFYEIRRKKPGLLRARDVMAVVWSSMFVPKEEHSEHLERLISKLEGMEGKDDKIRVILVGCLCQTPQFDILDLIEDLGMTVVDDDIYVGSRYFANDVEVNGNPLESIAERYLKKIPFCPTKGDWETKWGEYAIEMMRKNNAQGIISLLVKYCPPHMCYYPDFRAEMIKNGVNEVMIEVEHETVSFENIKMRLQSFVETIRGI